MRAIVTASAHFAITNDGNLWTPNPSLSYQFWSRYLDVYDEVNLLVRTKPHDSPPPGWNKASGQGIRPLPIPDFRGASGFLKNYVRIKKIAASALANAEAVHLRIPCDIGGVVWRSLASKRPYGVEVVGDPYDVFAPGSYKHPLRPFFRWWSVWDLQHQCVKACAAAYVTKYALQRRYPPGTEAFSTHFSSIDLPSSAFVTAPRSPRPDVELITIISVGTLAQLYKAPDVLIDAVATCVKEGLDLRLIWVGDGMYRKELETRVKAQGLDKRVNFCGHLPNRDAVIKELDRADIFVLPSYQEGLPRAMIEAMARGLPCIGSTVGGIPELLPHEDMVTAGNAMALAKKIRQVVTDKERMTLMSARNLETAKQYKDEVLQKRRIAFYNYTRDCTQLWLKQKHRSAYQ